MPLSVSRRMYAGRPAGSAFRALVCALGIALLGLLPGVASGQSFNLVHDPSFEEDINNRISPQRKTTGFIKAHWNSYRASPDLFYNHNNSDDVCLDCSISESANVPYNMLGYQQPYPSVDGERAYAGFWAGEWKETNGVMTNRMRAELLGQELKYPLVAGVNYTVSFRVSRAEASNIAMKEIGLYFSEIHPKSQSFRLATSLRPGAVSSTWVTSKTDWVEVTATYTAVGGERYIVIGAVPTIIAYEGIPGRVLPGVHWTPTEPGTKTCELNCNILPDSVRAALEGCTTDLRPNPTQNGCRLAYYYIDEIQVLGAECDCFAYKPIITPKHIPPYSDNPENCCFSLEIHNPTVCDIEGADAVKVDIITEGQYANPLENPFISLTGGSFLVDPNVQFYPSVSKFVRQFINPVMVNGQVYPAGSTTYIGDFCLKMPESGQVELMIWAMNSTGYPPGSGAGGSCSKVVTVGCPVSECCDYITPRFQRVNPCSNNFEYEIVFDIDLPEGAPPCNFDAVRIRRGNTGQSLVALSSSASWSLQQSSATSLLYSYGGQTQTTGTYSVGSFAISKNYVSELNEPVSMDILDANGKVLCTKALWLNSWSEDEVDCSGGNPSGSHKSSSGAEGGIPQQQSAVALLTVEPNPVSTGEVRVNVTLPSSSFIRVELYDMAGRLVRVLAEGERSGGVVQVPCSVEDLRSGTYYVKLLCNDRVLSVPLQVVR